MQLASIVDKWPSRANAPGVSHWCNDRLVQMYRAADALAVAASSSACFIPMQWLSGSDKTCDCLSIEPPFFLVTDDRISMENTVKRSYISFIFSLKEEGGAREDEIREGRSNQLRGTVTPL